MQPEQLAPYILGKVTPEFRVGRSFPTELRSQPGSKVKLGFISATTITGQPARKFAVVCVT